MLQRVLREEVGAQLVRLDMYLDMLDTIFASATPFATTPPVELLVGAILKVRQSGRAVKLLATEGLVEEILAIGRTLVEVTVNVTYLQSAGEKEMSRYLAFQPESQHRRAGMLQPRPKASSTNRMLRKIGDALSSLSPSASRAEPTWTHRSLAQRAQLSDEATGIPVMLPLLNRCYPRGDAAIHGTMGALAPFLESIHQPEALMRDNRMPSLADALFGINLTLMTFSLFLDEYFGLGMNETMEQISAADSSTKASLVGE
jgi:hypothetical protein